LIDKVAAVLGVDPSAVSVTFVKVDGKLTYSIQIDASAVSDDSKTSADYDEEVTRSLAESGYNVDQQTASSTNAESSSASAIVAGLALLIAAIFI